ncbi:MAG: hypothetical protein ACI4IG_00235 [Eubacterium sp.]
MKICETCGREISNFDVWSINNKIQCHECANEEFYNRNNNIQSNGNNSASYGNSMKPGNTNGKRHVNSTNGWASGMKTLTIIFLIVLLIASIIIAYFIGDYFDNIFVGIVVYIISTVSSFALVGFSMSFLQLAQDVSYLKNLFWQEFENK